MVFQNQDSVWTVIILLGIMAVVVAAVALIGLAKGTLSHTVVAVGLFVSLLMSCGGLFLAAKDRSDQDASFSKQLMDEYRATSSRPLSAIQRDVYRHHEATAVFTQDGRDTPVAIKVAEGSDNKVTMVFTVMNDKSLYPKPSK